MQLNFIKGNSWVIHIYQVFSLTNVDDVRMRSWVLAIGRLQMESVSHCWKSVRPRWRGKKLVVVTKLDIVSLTKAAEN